MKHVDCELLLQVFAWTACEAAVRSTSAATPTRSQWHPYRPCAKLKTDHQHVSLTCAWPGLVWEPVTALYCGIRSKGSLRINQGWKASLQGWYPFYGIDLPMCTKCPTYPNLPTPVRSTAPPTQTLLVLVLISLQTIRHFDTLHS